MVKSAFLFDLDGTIWDSYPFYAKVISDETGITKAAVVAKLWHGMSIVTLLKQFKVPENRLLNRSNELKLYPGVKETVEELKAQGRYCAIVTSLPGRFAGPLLAQAKLDFRVVIHAGNCKARKPHPGPLIAALKGLKIEPSRASCYVGDTARDAEAAKRAGLVFAWAKYGYSKEKVEADHTMSCFSEVLML